MALNDAGHRTNEQNTKTPMRSRRPREQGAAPERMHRTALIVWFGGEGGIVCDLAGGERSEGGVEKYSGSGLHGLSGRESDDVL
jgi:hypothetical protein